VIVVIILLGIYKWLHALYVHGLCACSVFILIKRCLLACVCRVFQSNVFSLHITTTSLVALYDNWTSVLKRFLFLPILTTPWHAGHVLGVDDYPNNYTALCSLIGYNSLTLVRRQNMVSRKMHQGFLI